MFIITIVCFYDFDDDGSLNFTDFTGIMRDIMIKYGKMVENDEQVKEEAKKFHAGGDVSENDFVRAVNSSKFQGTAVLFRALYSPVKCNPTHQKNLLNNSPFYAQKKKQSKKKRQNERMTEGRRHSKKQGQDETTK